MNTLQPYDIRLIQACKTLGNVDMDLLVTIWRERCNLAEDYPRTHILSAIAYHLARLVETYNPIPMPELIEKLDPARKWWWGLQPEATYVEQWVAVLASRLCLTEADKLPGYREAVL